MQCDCSARQTEWKAHLSGSQKITASCALLANPRLASSDWDARFLNADKPSPQGLEIFYGGKTGTGPLFRFVRTSKEPGADPASK